MASTRLPGKILKKVNDIPLLKYHLERLKMSNLPIFVATTKNQLDNQIVSFCEAEGYTYYRGDEFNVLSRFYEIAKMNKLDYIIRVSSDCPLIDGELIKTSVNKYSNILSHYIYLSNVLERSFPKGFDFELISFEYLKEAYLKAQDEVDLEHVTPYIHRNKNGKTQYEHIKRLGDASDYRLTVDTLEDFDLVTKLIIEHQASDKSFEEIISILDENPELVLINNHIEQKTHNN